MSIVVRTARKSDVPALVSLNRAAYPDLVQDGVVFDELQLGVHLQRFAEGQLVAEVDGEVVGGMATFILPPAIDALAPHTWMGVTDGGYFARHDPQGETLYLADIYVGERHWGRGVGRVLYQALFELCRRLELARVVAGGRLYGYCDHADVLSAQEYVRRVVRGEISDRVLVSQLRAGFAIRGLMPNYLHDWRSRHWATLLEWVNPHRPAAVLDVPRTIVASMSHR